jgi:soluble lytic murein transglycosylase-like protein
VSVTASPVPTDLAAPALGPQAAVARIAELQELIAQARRGAASNGGASFADALAGVTSSGGDPLAVAGGRNSISTGFGTNVTAAAGSDAGAGAYDGLVTAAAQRYGVDPALLHGLIQQESGFDPSATSGAGAQGLCQLMPGTAASLGVSDPLDPAQSIDGGARYLRQQLDAFGGDPSLALAAYNAGPGAVRRYGGVPPYAETQAYVQKVLGYANSFRGTHPSGVGGATAALAPVASSAASFTPTPTRDFT